MRVEKFILPILVLTSLTMGSVEGQMAPENENEWPYAYETYIKFYDYNTGEIMGEMWDISPTGLGGPVDGDYFQIWVDINSPQAIEIGLDWKNHKFYITCTGLSGSRGYFSLKIPARFVSPEAVKIEMDNHLISFDIENEVTTPDPLTAELWPDAVKILYGEYVVFSAQYTFSDHFFVITFGQAETAPSRWYAQPLNLALIALVIVAAIGAVYWFKFRRSP